VETVEHFDATAYVTKDGLKAEGDSIMGLLMLAAERGAMIEIETLGPEAKILAQALKELINSGFGEED
jgi:phosphocarrier protein